MRYRVFLLTILAVSFTTDTQARVARIEIVERLPFADSMEFGDVGAYEFIRGRLHYAVAPDNPHNEAIVDLQLAKDGRLRSDLSTIIDGKMVEIIGNDPRNSAGEVQFSADFILLKPVDLARGNHRLLYDVNNRGNLLMLGYYNNARGGNRPLTAGHAGNGWLMRQGYSLLWSAWNWDVENISGQPLRTNLPVITAENGEPMMAKIYAELGVQSRDGVTVSKIAWGGSRCYPAAEQFASEAELSVRDGGESERQTIPRDQWKFANNSPGGDLRFDPVNVYYPDGFAKGKVYELTYTATHPRVVGLGLAAVRDAISFFRFDASDDAGNPNPLAIGGTPDSQYAYIFGISQSGRFITQMIYQGFHVDERERLVFEGARPHVAGGGKGGFNYRFAQTTHHQKHLQGNFFLADHFPFHYMPEGMLQRDPLGTGSRREGDLLAVSKRLGKMPKIMICNHEGEYWSRSASLVHTDVEGRQDAGLHPMVRVYMVAGVRHGTPSKGSRRSSSTAEHSMNQLDPRPVGRALLTALDQWVSHNTEPPPSQVPRIDRNELISPQQHRDRFPRIPTYQFGQLEFPASRHPGVNLRPPRVDFGPRFWSEGIQDQVPPKTYGPRFVTLVPAINSDGNPTGGIRLPRLSVPLGTSVGFNPRHRASGSEDFLKAFDSSFWPFAQSHEQRKENGDPRPSIEERYENHADYVSKITAAADELLGKRLLLQEDRDAIVDFAQQMSWPPRPTDRWPFWELE